MGSSTNTHEINANKADWSEKTHTSNKLLKIILKVITHLAEIHLFKMTTDKKRPHSDLMLALKEN